jgi:hypothetical protein
LNKIEQIVKTISILFGKIFDTKIIESKGERGATRAVLPQAWSVTNESMSMRGKMGFELIVG